MANKKKAGEAEILKAEEAIEEVVEEKAEETPAEPEKEKEPELSMYVGPTIAEIAIQNRVYAGIPAGAAKVIEEVPEFRNLFIAIKDYPMANKMIRERHGYIYSAFKTALNIKNGGTKS